MRIKTIGIPLILLLVAGGWVLCEPPAARSTPADPASPASPGAAAEALAVVDGTPITLEEVDAAAGGSLRELQAQLYDIRRGALESLIDTLLLERAAKAKGTTAEAYLAQEVGDKLKPPTDQDVQAFYEQQRARIRAPLDQVREKIVEYLTQKQRQEAVTALAARLRKKADIQIRLEPPRTELSLKDPAYTLGNHGAPLVVVEFSDYQCPYSQRVQDAVVEVMEAYKGKVYYEFYDYPLPFHKQAEKAHEAVRCAQLQGKGHPYSRKLFGNQQKLEVDSLKGYAKELGLDTQAFDECLDSGRFAGSVAQSIEQGKGVGVTGTPAFFINGIFLSGAQPVDAFKRVMDQELAGGS